MSNNILTGQTEEEIQRFTHEAQMMEIKGMEITYHNLHDVCMKKCFNTTFDSAKLYKGESICLSKCTAKYLEFASSLQKKVQEAQELQMKQYEEQMKQQEAYVEDKGNWVVSAASGLWASWGPGSDDKKDDEKK